MCSRTVAAAHPDQLLACLELSLDRNIVFCGGSTKPNPQTKRPTAIITAMRFSNKPSIVDELLVTDQDATVVNCIKRASNESILFAGCYKHVYIIEFAANKFSLLMIAVDIHSSTLDSPGTIYDMCVFGTKLYSVGKRDKFISILNFDFDL